MGHLTTRNTGAQSDKCNCINAVFEVDEATKMSGNVSNDGSASPDEEDRNDKSDVAVGNSLKKERHYVSNLKLLEFMWL